MNDIKKLTLKNEIKFQQGYAVSRYIKKEKSSNIVLYAFDADESINDYCSPYENIVCIIDGETEIQAGSETYSVNAGEILLIPPNVLYNIRAKIKSIMLLVINS